MSLNHRSPKIIIQMYICAKNWHRKRNWPKRAYKCGFQIVGLDCAKTQTHMKRLHNFPVAHRHYQHYTTTLYQPCQFQPHSNGRQVAWAIIWARSKCQLITSIHYSIIQMDTITLTRHCFQITPRQHRVYRADQVHPAAQHQWAQCRVPFQPAHHQIACPIFHTHCQLSLPIQ